MDVDLDLDAGLRLRALAVGDAALQAGATSGEKEPSELRIIDPGSCGAEVSGCI